MANTTNFNWETPDDTDLVKDGALAIRTLGNSIDTSFVDLKGGTTGQILSKNSNTDLDYTWINNDTGDITGVTAGTGISGGGTSGTVTITNSMATEITAAGDIIVGTGSGTFDNLPIGTTGHVLTADTTVSPYKVKWAAAASDSYTQLAAANLPTNASSLEISSISTSYKKLILIVRDYYSTNNQNFGVRFNSDSTNGNYIVVRQSSDSSSTASNNTNTSSLWFVTETGVNNAQSDNTILLELENYADSTVNKVFAGRAFYQDNGAAYYSITQSTCGYKSTTAISAITIMTGSDNFTAGNYVLLGVK